MSQHGPKQGIVRNVVEFFFGPPAIEARVAMLERQVASLRQAIPQTQAGSPPARPRFHPQFARSRQLPPPQLPRPRSLLAPRHPR